MSGHMTNEEYYASNFNNGAVEEIAAQRDRANDRIEVLEREAAAQAAVMKAAKRWASTYKHCLASEKAGEPAIYAMDEMERRSDDLLAALDQVKADGPG